MLFTPTPPVTNCHTFSDPLPALERDVLYGQPHIYMHNPAIVYIWNDFIHIGNALGL